jgi:multidrug resistance efflux pump
LYLLREEYQKLLMGEIPAAESASTNLRAAERQAEIAGREYERARDLLDKGLVGAEQVEEKKQEYERSRSCYQAFKELAELSRRRYEIRIREKEEEIELLTAGHELTARRTGKAAVIASMTGRVLTPEPERLVGAEASSKETAFLIGDLSEMDFVGEMSQIDISRVREGQEAKVFVDAYPHHKYKVFKGAVIGVSQAPRMTGRGISFEVKVRIEDPWVGTDSSRQLLSAGLSASGKIVIWPRVRLIELLFGSR